MPITDYIVDERALVVADSYVAELPNELIADLLRGASTGAREDLIFNILEDDEEAGGGLDQSQLELALYRSLWSSVGPDAPERDLLPWWER
jgi:hypothetical protein